MRFRKYVLKMWKGFTRLNFDLDLLFWSLFCFFSLMSSFSALITFYRATRPSVTKLTYSSVTKATIINGAN